MEQISESNSFVESPSVVICGGMKRGRSLTSTPSEIQTAKKANMNNSADLFNLSYQFNELANGQNSDGPLPTSQSAVIDKEFSKLVMDALKGNQIQA